MEFDFPRKDFDPVICLCESENLKAAVEMAKRMSDGKRVLQLFGTDRGVRERIVPAYLNAKLRSYDGCMRTKSIRSEMLLFVSGKLDITKAIVSCGASGSRFVVFSDSKVAFELFARNVKIKVLKRYRPALDFGAAQSVSSTELRSE